MGFICGTSREEYLGNVRTWLAQNPSAKELTKCVLRPVPTDDFGNVNFRLLKLRDEAAEMCSDALEARYPEEFKAFALGILSMPMPRTPPTMNTVCINLGGGITSCTTQ